MPGVNSFEMSDELLDSILSHEAWNEEAKVEYKIVDSDIPIVKIHNLIPSSIREILVREIQKKTWLPVGIDGFANKEFEKVGNYRLSLFNEDLSHKIYSRIMPYLPANRHMDEYTPTDHDNIRDWKMTGINPLFRFIQYKSFGELVAHYDSTYKESDDVRSLMTLVIYLTDNDLGATRFLTDRQKGSKITDMDVSDWNRSGSDDEVIHREAPSKGDAIIFDHKILHDSEPIGPHNEKIIIRTDIMYERM